jgi:hypothetical protein
MTSQTPPPAVPAPLDYARKHKRASQWERWTAAVMLAALAASGAALIAWSLTASLGRAREPANRVKCASNMHQIGHAIQLYAAEHGGRFPDRLADLYLTLEVSSEMFVCASSTDEKATGATMQEVAHKLSDGNHHVSYIYTGRGLTLSTVNVDTVLLHERLDNHDNDGADCLFGDFHVEFATAPWIRHMTKELSAGHNPPREFHER